MDNKVYIIFIHSAWYNFEGSWDGETNLDSVWSNLDLAKQRLNNISNDLIEKLWYEEGVIPKEEWNVDKTSVKYEPDQYTEYVLYIKEQKVRSGLPQDEKDLSAYFTTT